MMTYLGEPYDTSYFRSLSKRPEGYGNYRELESVVRGIANDIESELGSVSGKEVLEVGCAFGYLVDELALRGATATGLDVSTYAIDEARRLFPARAFIARDALDTGFGDSVFDAVLAMGMLECMPNLPALRSLLREMGRVTRPGARIYVLLADTPPFLHLTADQWLSEFSAAFPGKNPVLTNVGHLPVFYKWRVVI